MAQSTMWINVMSLGDVHLACLHVPCLLLVAVMKLIMHFLYLYVDDSFLAQKRNEMLFYKGYQKTLLSNLTHLLQLWDFIGLPHEEDKASRLSNSASGGEGSGSAVSVQHTVLLLTTAAGSHTKCLLNF